MSQITLRFVGEQTASKILGFYSVMNTAETPLKDCEFLDVQNGDTITCSAGAYGTFKRKTRFEVYYDGDDEDEADCIGDAKTKCSKPIIGDSLKNCDDLVVVSHVDGDGALCNANVLSTDIAILESNAFVDNRRLTTDPLRVWKGLDLWIRWMLICLLIAFSALISISCFLCGLRRRAEVEQTEKEEKLDDILKHIAMKKWRANSNSNSHLDEVEGSVVRHIAMTLAQRSRERHRAETWGANKHTVVVQKHHHHHHHRIEPANSSGSSDEADTTTTSSDDDEDEIDETEDLDLAYEDEYYFDEEEEIPTVMHYDDGTNFEYAE